MRLKFLWILAAVGVAAGVSIVIAVVLRLRSMKAAKSDVYQVDTEIGKADFSKKDKRIIDLVSQLSDLMEKLEK